MARAAVLIFSVIFLGWLTRRTGLTGKVSKNFLDGYLVLFALPAIIISETMKLSLGEISAGFVAVNVLPMLFQMLLVFGAARAGLLGREFAKVLLIVPALGNAVYLGFPVVKAMFGASALGYAAVLSSLQSVAVFTAGFFLFTSISGKAPGSPVRDLLKNSVLWSVAAGLLLSWGRVELPGALPGVLEAISKTALPAAMFSMGMGLFGKKAGGDWMRVSAVLAMKFFLLPILCLAVIGFFSLEGRAFEISFMEHAMPPAALNFILAKKFGFDEKLTSRAIIAGTLLFFPLLPFFEYLLKNVL